MKIKGFSHVTFLVKDLEKSSKLFQYLFDAVEVYSSGLTGFSKSPEKFLLVGEIWIALMEGPSLPRSYNHVAFQISEDDLEEFEKRLKSLNLEILEGRPRHPEEGRSIYFYDYDNHLLEVHTGTLIRRLSFYTKFDK